MIFRYMEKEIIAWSGYTYDITEESYDLSAGYRGALFGNEPNRDDL